jgi:hypothetical protein
MSSKTQSQKDTRVAKHAAYLRALEAGALRLRNGRMAVGGVMGHQKNKAAQSKKACRKKVDY